MGGGGAGRSKREYGPACPRYRAACPQQRRHRANLEPLCRLRLKIVEFCPESRHSRKGRDGENLISVLVLGVDGVDTRPSWRTAPSAHGEGVLAPTPRRDQIALLAPAVHARRRPLRRHRAVHADAHPPATVCVGSAALASACLTAPLLVLAALQASAFMIAAGVAAAALAGRAD